MFVPFIQNYSPDIVCLQETKALQHQSQIDLPDYHEYWESASRLGYGGVAIFSKQEPLSVSRGLPAVIAQKYTLTDAYGDPLQEGRILVLEFERFYVVSVYTPNAKDDLSRIPLRHKNWDPAFLEYMKQLSMAKPVMFCGDLNVAHTEEDLARPKQNIGKKGFTIEEREGVEKILEAGFVDTFRLFTKGSGHYTWWSNFFGAREKNIGWRIDYIFASKELKPYIQKASILKEVYGSDHCPILLEVEF